MKKDRFQWFGEFIDAGLMVLSIVLVYWACVHWVVRDNFEAAIFCILLAIWAKW